MLGHRSLFVMLIVGIISGLFVTTALAVTPANGVYQGTEDGSQKTNGHNEGEGFMRVKKGTNGKKIVPPGNFACGAYTCASTTILIPVDPGFKCGFGNRLSATSIAISAGAFDYKGKAAQGPGGAQINMKFKGAWVTSSKVKGFSRTWDANCDTGKMFWTMKTPPPA
jgi:hypothetical protein